MLFETAYESYARVEVDVLCKKFNTDIPKIMKEMKWIKYNEYLHEERKRRKISQNKKITNQNKQKLKLENGTENIQTINQIYTEENYEEIIRISEQEKDVIIDKGSDVNLIGDIYVKTLGIAIEKIEPIILKNFAGKITEVNEQVRLTITYNDIIITTNFLVVECENPMRFYLVERH